MTERPADGLRAAARLRYRLPLAGVGFGWLTDITHWKPPFAFVDEHPKGRTARRSTPTHSCPRGRGLE